MFMNDVCKKDEIRDIAVGDLRKFGVKFPRKKVKPAQTQDVRKTAKCFKVELNNLPTQLVTLNDGQQLIVPIIVHELCSFITSKIDTEGLFRKEGSKPRQNEIKLSLNAGCKIDEESHVIDVANLLKTFLRELPEPLIPKRFHEHFLRCTILSEKKLDAILLLCLLLPQEHLNTLAYLTRFLNTVSKHSERNKMNSVNLSIVIGPNLIPIEQEKSTVITQNRIKKMCELVQLLIENSDQIGIIPVYIIDQVAGNISENEDNPNLTVEKKKKRRSGSLTRMFNGLKKMVGNKPEENSPVNIITPDLLLTPCITRSAKKRKIETTGISSKKKRELISKLPEKTVLKTPFAPQSTPVSANPNEIASEKRKSSIGVREKTKEKKSQWYTRNRNKTSAPAPTLAPSVKVEENVRSSRTSLNSVKKSLIERRWSAVSNVSNFRRKLRSSREKLCEINQNDHENDINEDSNFVKISKSEYEEIKQRVSEIERRISMEIEQTQQRNPTIIQSTSSQPPTTISNVQTVYEQTLNEMEPLSPTTDHLARRLSKELKIRRNSERIVRSPSERKIERRRRSLSRNKSMNSVETTPKEDWKSAETFLSNTSLTTPKTPSHDNENNVNGRPSVVKIRNQNAGMVLARAKLFESEPDLDQIVPKREIVREKRRKISPRTRTRQSMRLQQATLPSPKIKRPLISNKSTHTTPKRLCRSPYSVEKSTPLKVVQTTWKV